VRAFIAIDINDEVRAALGGMQQRLARTRAKVTWVDPANIHLTMKFLGEIDDAMLEPVKGAMANAASETRPIEFDVAGLGTFPPGRPPRVVWAGVTRGADRITSVQARLERALEPFGFKKERRFTPHLTLGRVKSPKGSNDLLDRIARAGDTAFGSCVADKLILFESTLTPQGAKYRVTATTTLEDQADS
jgi:2'-5' RNA ligase